MPRLLTCLLALCLVAGTAGGCGDGAPVAATRGAIHVTLDEYELAPQHFTVSAGELRIDTRNDGILTHNLVVRTIPPNSQAPPIKLRSTATLHPGQRARGRPIKLRPGRYLMICTIANHGILGEYGTIEVK